MPRSPMQSRSNPIKNRDNPRNAPILSRIGALRGSDALGERRFSARQPVYRVSQLVFRLVESAFRFC